MDTLGHDLLHLSVEIQRRLNYSYLRIPMSFPCQLCKEPRETSSHVDLVRYGRFIKSDEVNPCVQGEKGGSPLLSL